MLGQPCGWQRGVPGRCWGAILAAVQSEKPGQRVEGNRRCWGAGRKEWSSGRCAGKWEKFHRPGPHGRPHCLERLEASGEYWGTRESRSGKALVPGAVSGMGNTCGGACEVTYQMGLLKKKVGQNCISVDVALLGSAEEPLTPPSFPQLRGGPYVWLNNGPQRHPHHNFWNL